MNNSDNVYDVVIIGGGPAGLTAGIYTSRARLGSLLIEKGLVGGQILNAEKVDNYPGFPEGINGMDLTQSMHQQATKFGLKTVIAETTGIEIRGNQKVVKTDDADYVAKAVIIAGGSERYKLGVPGEEKYNGRGVSYCATCGLYICYVISRRILSSISCCTCNPSTLSSTVCCVFHEVYFKARRIPSRSHHHSTC